MAGANIFDIRRRAEELSRKVYGKPLDELDEYSQGMVFETAIAAIQEE